jgi:hypothetical protein
MFFRLMFVTYFFLYENERPELIFSTKKKDILKNN